MKNIHKVHWSLKLLFVFLTYRAVGLLFYYSDSIDYRIWEGLNLSPLAYLFTFTLLAGYAFLAWYSFKPKKQYSDWVQPALWITYGVNVFYQIIILINSDSVRQYYIESREARGFPLRESQMEMLDFMFGPLGFLITVAAMTLLVIYIARYFKRFHKGV